MWILLIHQLPPKPTNLRVRIWRKLQKLGAVAIKNSVYVLPANEKTHEDFQWLKQEIESAGGEATVFQASSVAGAPDEEIIAAFNKARDEEFAGIAAELDGLAGAISQQTRGSISQRDDSLRTNRSWIGCMHNWRASLPMISSTPRDAAFLSRPMNVVRRQFAMRTLRYQKPPARTLNQELWSRRSIGAGAQMRFSF